MKYCMTGWGSVWSTTRLNCQWCVCSGDDGTSKDAVSTGKLNQENEHIYNLWCSGRVCCEGMLIQLKVWAACSCEGVCGGRCIELTCSHVSILVVCFSFWRGRTCSTCWPGWWGLPGIKWCVYTNQICLWGAGFPFFNIFVPIHVSWKILNSNNGRNVVKCYLCLLGLKRHSANSSHPYVFIWAKVDRKTCDI